MNEETIKKMALMVAANCLTSDNIQPTSEQLKKQVTDRLYTFLLYLLNKPSGEYTSLISGLTNKCPEDWPWPDLDQSFLNIARQSIHQNQGQPFI